MWTISSTAIGALVYFLAWLLDYKWHDKRKKRFSWTRWLLLFLGLALLIVNCLAGLRDAKTLQSRFDGLHRQQASNTRAITRELRSRLSPFEKLAAERYPSATAGTALKKLSIDLAKLGEKTDAIERRFEPRTVAARTRRSIIDTLRRSPKCRLGILYPVGDREALAYAKQIDACFREAGWRTNGSDGWIGPLTGMRIATPGSAQAAPFRAVLHAMGLAGAHPRTGRSESPLEDIPLEEGTITIAVGSKD